MTRQRQAIIEDGWRAFLEWARIAYRELLHVTQLDHVLPRLPASLTQRGWKYTVPRAPRIRDREDFYDNRIPTTDSLGYPQAQRSLLAYPVVDYPH